MNFGGLVDCSLSCCYKSERWVLRFVIVSMLVESLRRYWCSSSDLPSKPKEDPVF